MTDAAQIVCEYMVAFAARKRPRIVARGEDLFVETGKGYPPNDDEVTEAVRWLVAAGWPSKAEDISALQVQLGAVEDAVLTCPVETALAVARMMATSEGRDFFLKLINDSLSESAVSPEHAQQRRRRVIAMVRDPLPKAVGESFRQAVAAGKKHVRIEIIGDDAVVVWDEE